MYYDYVYYATVIIDDYYFDCYYYMYYDYVYYATDIIDDYYNLELYFRK